MKKIFLFVIVCLHLNTYSQSNSCMKKYRAYKIVSEPNDTIISESSFIKYNNEEILANSNNKYIMSIIDKEPFFICFTYCGANYKEILSFTKEDKIYCYDTLSNKIISYRQMFYRYYGNIERYEKSKSIEDTIDTLYKIYTSGNLNETRSRLKYLDDLNLMLEKNYSTNNFLKVLSNYVSLDSNESYVLESLYIESKLYNIEYSSYEKKVERLNYLEVILQDALSPSKYLKYLFNKDVYSRLNILLGNYIVKNEAKQNIYSEKKSRKN